MNQQQMSRRALLKSSGAAVAGLAFLKSPEFARAVPLQQDEAVIPWLDPLLENPIPDVLSEQLEWQALESWITPSDEFFSVAHYGVPELDEESWQLQITGLVHNPLTLTLADLKERRRQELTFTLECSGNHGFPWFTGGIGNAEWAGASLLSLLREADVRDEAVEVVFYGADAGEQVVREQTFMQNFGRSLSIDDAMNPQNLLCYEMNGEPLAPEHGYPVRLIVPGWYGIANVKWLTRIEVLPTRYAGHFMARDYVTLRQEERDGEPFWVETSVGPSLLKSAPARVVQVADGGYRIDGAAWGAPVERVEVRIDDGAWQEATLDWEQYAPHAWLFWSFDWADAAPGEHTITSRAIDAEGNVQPAPDDAWIENKITYWESTGQITRQVEIPE